GLLPYVEQSTNNPASPLPVATFICPSRRAPQDVYCDYAGFLPWYLQTGTINTSTWTWTWKYTQIRTVLGDDLGVRIDDITDGTANTAVLTDKYVDPGDYKKVGNVPGNYPWSVPGPPTYRLNQGQTGTPIFVSTNTKRSMSSSWFIQERNTVTSA